jgi:hypothetical protein
MNNDAATTGPRDQPAGDTPARRLVEWLLIVAVFFVIAGDAVPGVNEPHYLCRLKHYWCPPWGAGDLFLDSPDAHFMFVWTFGWLTNWLSLPATAWVGRLLAWGLLAGAWQRLSWRLVPVPLASVLSAALWVVLTQRAHLAGEWVVGGVEAKCFAYVFVLLAIRAVVDRRWNRAWLLLGAASAFHALVGGWSVVVCGGIWLVDRTLSRAAPSASIVTMLPGLIGGGLIALLGVVPALALAWHESPQTIAEANRIYVFERLPHHLALLTLPTAQIIERFTRHAVLLFVLLVIARANRRLAATEHGDRGQPDDALAVVTWYACGAALLAAAGLLIELLFWNEPPRAAAVLRFYWFRLTDFAVPMAVSLQIVAFLAAGFARRRRWAVWALALAIAFLAWHVVPLVRQRADYPLPPADRQMRDPAAWVDACEWIAAHTPPDALFLTPRRAHSFKWRTGRAEVATWKDVPQDARSMVEWFGRVRKAFYVQAGDQWLPLASVGELGTRRVRVLAQEFGVDYVVTDRRFPLALPIVYPNAEHRNEEYVVYSIEH